MKNDKDSRLIRLGSTGKFKVADRQNDVTGWPVIGSNGSQLGKVHDLIIDREKEIVRYLEVDAETRYPEVEDKHVLVPVGLATIHSDNRIVAVKDLTEDKLRNYPVYHGDSITRDYEYSIRDYLSKPTSRAEMFSDRLSPEREKEIREEERKRTFAQQTELIRKLKEEKNAAIAERDKAVQERDNLRNEIDSLRNSDSSNRNISEDRNNAYVQDQTDDDAFYHHYYFDCNEFEDGRKCY